MVSLGKHISGVDQSSFLFPVILPAIIFFAKLVWEKIFLQRITRGLCKGTYKAKCISVRRCEQWFFKIAPIC